MSSIFLLQELRSVSGPQYLHQKSPTVFVITSSIGKKYSCPHCSYKTDKRQSYASHKKIHLEEKPYHCYICYKPFCRADHVKKHIIRIHRDQVYDVARIRKNSANASKPLQQDSNSTSTDNGANGQQQHQQQHATYMSDYSDNKNYQLQPNPKTDTTADMSGIYQETTMTAPGIMQPDVNNSGTRRRISNSECNSKNYLKKLSRRSKEGKYSCNFCPWTGVEDRFLKLHLNTHLRPYACSLCEYKGARSDSLIKHVLNVHNRSQCSKCSYIALNGAELQVHQMRMHCGTFSRPQPKSSVAKQHRSLPIVRNTINYITLVEGSCITLTKEGIFFQK